MVVSVRRVALVGLVTLLVISSCVLTAAAGGKKRTRRTQCVHSLCVCGRVFVCVWLLQA